MVSNPSPSKPSQTPYCTGWVAVDGGPWYIRPTKFYEPAFRNAPYVKKRSVIE